MARPKDPLCRRRQFLQPIFIFVPARLITADLTELAVLMRLSPQRQSYCCIILAAYAKSPANWPALRNMLRQNPSIAGPALSGLAAHLETASAVVALADFNEKPKDSPWLEPLLTTLTGGGKYQEAHRIWAHFTSAKSMELLHDPDFRDANSPPPFNWSLTSSTVGIAERQAGRLHLLFYGQEDGILASELLLLEPGQYELSMQLQGNRTNAHSLTWSIWCDRSDMPIASVNLDLASSRGWNFTVPPACPAQMLRLSGVAVAFPRQVDLTIASLKLRKAGKGD